MYKYILLLIFGSTLGLAAQGQNNYKLIPLPQGISSVNEEFSGLAQWQNRIYFSPQYGSHKQTKLTGRFNIYSIKADSITRVIEGNSQGLYNYKTLKVLNLDQLPDSVKASYEGFEAISIVEGKVFLSIETNEAYNYCFILKGTIDTLTNRISINPKTFVSLKRPLYIKNAGFEALTYLPKQHQLLATYEFNATQLHKTAYLIDTALNQPAQAVSSPYQYFRITDMETGADGKLYAVNYYYNGDYQSYLNNSQVHNAEGDIKQKVPALRDSLSRNPSYLKQFTYASIIKLNNYKAKHWQTLTTFDGFKNNWEGITLFKKGALIITDANRSAKQVSILAYIEF